jgi:glycosyltransferase involved in cell wall biosynthesis
MKVLMLNTYDQRGGAARAAWRHFQGLKASGVDIRLLVQEKQSDDPAVEVLVSPCSRLLNPLRPYIDFAIPLVQTRKRILFSTSLLADNLIDKVRDFNPDVVHLNWITGGFIRIETLAKIPCPVIWTLHDMWAVTGGCHNTTTCNRFMTGCGKCPLLHSGKINDLSRKTFDRKRETYQQMKHLTLTAPSHWLAGLTGESPLLNGRPVRVIPNGLDTEIFLPVDKVVARKKTGLNPEKAIVVFGAIRATETPLKGFSTLINALRLVNFPDLQLVVFGSEGPSGTDITGLDVQFRGVVNSDEALVDLYSAADIVAVPSSQEVFGQAVTEAMACGTPVVAFRCTGLMDLVVHKETGYLAEPGDAESLADGISWLLHDRERRENLGRNARRRAVDYFDIKQVANQFIDLYSEVLHG